MDLSPGSDAAAMAWIQQRALQRALIQDSRVPTRRRAEGPWALIRESLERGVSVARFWSAFAAGRGRSDSASTSEVSISPGCA